MRTATLLLTMSLFSSFATADETCQAFMDKIASRLAVVDKMNSLDRPAKCHAYELVTSDALGVVKACSHNQDEVNLTQSKFKPMMEHLAHAQETFCSR